MRPILTERGTGIDRSGEKVLPFDSRVEPQDPALVGAIERWLAASWREP